MRRILHWLLAVPLLLSAPPATAVDLTPVWIGAQWGPNTGGVELVPRCNAPNSGGFSCIYLPSGGRVRALDFHMTTMGGGEILLLLTTGPDPNALLCCPYRNLTVAHQFYNAPVTKTIQLPGDGVMLPPGTYVWAYVQGWPVTALIFHTTLWMDAGTSYTIVLPGQVIH